MKKILTLVFILRGGEILLGMKKRGFGAGKWNGFGGKVEAGEPIEAAARRELLEEAGLAVKNLEKVGELTFFGAAPEALEVQVFRAGDFQGEPRESDEMKPRWFAVEDIPYGEMWPDDPYWLPLLIAGKKFRGTFHFGPEQTLRSGDVKEI